MRPSTGPRVCAEGVRRERRAPEAINPNMITGEIEVLANAVQVLNTSVTPPFSI